MLNPSVGQVVRVPGEFFPEAALGEIDPPDEQCEIVLVLQSIEGMVVVKRPGGQLLEICTDFLF